MDDSIHSGLEDYLSGSASPEFLRALDKDPRAQIEVRQMRELSDLITTLRADEVAVPPYFYAKLATSIEKRQAARSEWNPFSFQSAFGRRVAYASLLTLTFVGTYLVARDDSSKQFVASPEAILASHDVSVDHSPADDRDTMMVTLASYGQ
jgi:hypothetical protein